MKPTMYIGNTPVQQAPVLRKILGTGPLYFKLEGRNPTGSHKDRLALSNVEQALAENKIGITAGTCGSYGLSIAWLCNTRNFDCKIFVPQKYTNAKISQIHDYTENIIFVDGTYEDAVRESQRFSMLNNYYDANPFGNNSTICYQAYQQLAVEILNDIAGKIDVVWLPVGNGTTFTGLYHGMSRHGHYPLYGVVSSLNNSAVISSLKSFEMVLLNKDRLTENQINEPLCTWMPPTNTDELIAISRKASLICAEVEDSSLLNAARLLSENEGISVPPYAAAGLAGLIQEKSSFDSETLHLIVLTS